MEPFSMASFVIGAAVGGVIGNRTDDVFVQIVNRMRKGDPPVNHDLQRAVRKSYLQATLALCEARYKELGISSNFLRRDIKYLFKPTDEIKWLDKVRDEIIKEIQKIPEAQYIPPSSKADDDLELLLETKKTGKERRDELSKELKNGLLEELGAKYGTIPDRIVEMLKNGWDDTAPDGSKGHFDWFELLSAFFVHELKTQEKVRAIFEGQLLVGTGLSLKDIEEQNKELVRRLELLGEHLTKLRTEQAEGFASLQERLDEMLPKFALLTDISRQQDVLLGIVQELLIEVRRYPDEIVKRLEDRFGKNHLAKILQERTQNFINELCQRPFVPRQSLWNEISEFFINEKRGIILLYAPAGYGKTTTLSHWVKGLQKNGGMFIICHFFSRHPILQGYATSPINAFAHLLGQISAITNTSVSLSTNPDERRAEIEKSIKEWDSDKNGKLLIVLDALDEADELFSPFIPAQLPEGVFVIVSGRWDGSGDPPDYLEKWSKIADKKVRMDAMCEEEIAEWIRHTGDKSLADLADRNGFVQRIREKTEGLPLFLNFLMDDLKRAAEEGMDIHQVLEQTPEGFYEYVKSQIKQLAPLVKNEQSVRNLLAMLSVAKGHLRASELESLDIISVLDMEGLPYQITRWWNIGEQDGEHTYAFAHPLLAMEFAKALGKEAKEARRNLLTWCTKWKEHKCHYALRFVISHLADSVIDSLKNEEEAGDENRYARGYVEQIVNIITDNKFRELRSKIGLKASAQVEDIKRGIIAALICGENELAEKLLLLLFETRKSTTSLVEIERIIKSDSPDPFEIIDELAIFRPDEQAALALWFAVRLDERGFRETATKLIEHIFKQYRLYFATFPSQTILEYVIRALMQRARIDLARDISLRIKEIRGFDNPEYALKLFKRSNEKEDIRRAISALKSESLPRDKFDILNILTFWGDIYNYLLYNPDIELIQEVMSNFAYANLELLRILISNGYSPEIMPIREFISSLNNSDDYKRIGLSLARLSAGIIESNRNIEEVRSLLIFLGKSLNYNSIIAKWWISYSLWSCKVNAQYAKLYVFYLLSEISPLIDEIEKRDEALLHLAIEISAHARWSALEDDKSESEIAQSIKTYLELMSKVEEHISDNYKLICRAILELTIRWGETYENIPSKIREVYKNARSGSEVVSPNRVAMTYLQERLGWEIELDPTDEYNYEWINNWMQRKISSITSNYELVHPSGKLTYRGYKVHSDLKIIADICEDMLDILPAPVLSRIADFIISKSVYLFGPENKIICCSRMELAFDLFEPVSSLQCDGISLAEWSLPDDIRAPINNITNEIFSNILRQVIITKLKYYDIPILPFFGLRKLLSKIDVNPEDMSQIVYLLNELNIEDKFIIESLAIEIGEYLLEKNNYYNKRDWLINLIKDSTDSVLNEDTYESGLGVLIKEVWRSGDTTLVKPILDLINRVCEKDIKGDKIVELFSALIANHKDDIAKEVLSKVVLSDEYESLSRYCLWKEFLDTISSNGSVDKNILREMDNHCEYISQEITKGIFGLSLGEYHKTIKDIVLSSIVKKDSVAESNMLDIRKDWESILDALPDRCKRSIVEPVCLAGILNRCKDLINWAKQIAEGMDDYKSAECIAWAMLGIGEIEDAKRWVNIFLERGGGISDILGAAGYLDLLAEKICSDVINSENPWERLKKLLERTGTKDKDSIFPYFGISDADSLKNFLKIMIKKAPVDECARDSLECDSSIPIWLRTLPDYRALCLGDLGRDMIDKSIACGLSDIAELWAELILTWTFINVKGKNYSKKDIEQIRNWDEINYVVQYIYVVGFLAGKRSQSYKSEYVGYSISIANNLSSISNNLSLELNRNSPFYWALIGLDKSGIWISWDEYNDILDRVVKEKSLPAKLAYAEYCAGHNREDEAHRAFDELLRDEEPGFLHIRAADSFKKVENRLMYLRVALNAKEQSQKFIGQFVKVAAKTGREADEILEQLQTRHRGTVCEGLIILARAYILLKNCDSNLNDILLALDMISKVNTLLKKGDLLSFGIEDLENIEYLYPFETSVLYIFTKIINIDSITPDFAIKIYLEYSKRYNFYPTAVLGPLLCKAAMVGTNEIYKKSNIIKFYAKTPDLAIKLIYGDISLTSDAPRRLLIESIESSGDKERSARKAINELAKYPELESVVEDCLKIIKTPEQSLLARDDIFAARGSKSVIERLEFLAHNAVDGEYFRERVYELAKDAIKQLNQMPIDRREKIASFFINYIDIPKFVDILG